MLVATHIDVIIVNRGQGGVDASSGAADEAAGGDPGAWRHQVRLDAAIFAGPRLEKSGHRIRAVGRKVHRSAPSSRHVFRAPVAMTFLPVAGLPTVCESGPALPEENSRMVRLIRRESRGPRRRTKLIEIAPRRVVFP